VLRRSLALFLAAVVPLGSAGAAATVTTTVAVTQPTATPEIGSSPSPHAAPKSSFTDAGRLLPAGDEPSGAAGHE